MSFSLEMAGVSQPFHFSLMARVTQPFHSPTEWLMQHFTFHSDGNGCVAISFRCETAGVTRSFYFSPRRQGSPSHFIALRAGRGYAAISFSLRCCIANLFLPKAARVAWPFWLIPDVARVAHAFHFRFCTRQHASHSHFSSPNTAGDVQVLRFSPRRQGVRQ